MKYASVEKQQQHNLELKILYERMQQIKEQLLAERPCDFAFVYEHPVYRDAEDIWREKYNSCPECGSTEADVQNYDPMWRDGDVVCRKCDTYVRGYDAG